MSQKYIREEEITISGALATDYEKRQMTEIEIWKEESPGIVSQAFGVVTYPVTWLMEKIIPASAIKGLLDAANRTAAQLADKDDICRLADVENIQGLRKKKLKLSDQLADNVHDWAVGVAALEGGATGFSGLPGLAVDIPAIITLALRTIHKIGLCYGYEFKTEVDKNFVLAILSASGANSLSEKLTALITLRNIEVIIAKQSWKVITEKAAAQQMSKESAIIATKNLLKQLGINLTKRKILQAIPAIGAAVGASVNGWYIKEVGWAARRSFQERWLIDNHKIIDI